jgi:hypothetical protein
MGEAAPVLDAYWDRFLAIEPLFATAVGDSRFDDLLPDPAEDGRAERSGSPAAVTSAASTTPSSGSGCCPWPTCAPSSRRRRPVTASRPASPTPRRAWCCRR